jgi:phosphoserine aminotransferase
MRALTGIGATLGSQRLAAPERKRRAPAACVQARASSSYQANAATASKRAFNFSAGPAILPLDVLKQAQDELVDWHGSGVSVLEMSHRGPEFESIIAKAEKDLRTLMKIPDNYKVRRA